MARPANEFDGSGDGRVSDAGSLLAYGLWAQRILALHGPPDSVGTNSARRRRTATSGLSEFLQEAGCHELAEILGNGTTEPLRTNTPAPENLGLVVSAALHALGAGVRWEAGICQVDSWPPALERHFPQAPTRLVFEPTQGIEEVKADRLGDYHIQDAVGAGDADLQQSRDGAVQFVAEELALDKSRFLRARTTEISSFSRHCCSSRGRGTILSKDIFNGSWLPHGISVSSVMWRRCANRGGHRPLRVRLSLTREGVVTIQAAQLPSASVLTVVLGAEVVDPDDVDVYHKTTHREQYDNAQSGARAAGGGRGDSAEPAWRIDRVCDRQSRLEHEGRRITPALTCGLLPGTFRAEMLAMGQIEEGVLRAADAIKADAIYMINSVRRWVPLQLRGVAGRVNQTTEERAPCTG